MSTIISSGSTARNSAVLTDSSAASFFLSARSTVSVVFLVIAPPTVCLIDNHLHSSLYTSIIHTAQVHNQIDGMYQSPPPLTNHPSLALIRNQIVISFYMTL